MKKYIVTLTIEDQKRFTVVAENQEEAADQSKNRFHRIKTNMVFSEGAQVNFLSVESEAQNESNQNVR